MAVQAQTESILQGVNISGTITDFNRKVLSKDAVAFLALLHRSFNGTRKELLQRRVIRQQELDKGALPDFLPETKHIRENDAWKGARPAPGLVDRRVEITGPTDRKMVVNALNSNVWTYMADFEGISIPKSEFHLFQSYISSHDEYSTYTTIQIQALLHGTT